MGALAAICEAAAGDLLQELGYPLEFDQTQVSSAAAAYYRAENFDYAGALAH